jgi:NAD-dependent deacetylase
VENVKQTTALVRELQRIIDRSDCIVFFGGAGVSTESGLPDFRSSGGLYRQKHPYPPETMLSRSFFRSHPEEFFAYYKENLIFRDARPNSAHIALASLEKAGKLKAVVTQNIDGLHQMAGSRKVLELHGSVHRNFCADCRKCHDADYVLNSAGIPRCSCGGVVEPDVVLYEDSLDRVVLAEAAGFIRRTDVLIVGGTSLAVHPAAGLVEYYPGRKMVLINKEAGPYDDQALLSIHGSIGEILGSIRI